MKLAKKDFSCWGNGDKYDDELIITHEPKIHSRTIADQILKNQEDAEKWSKINTEYKTLQDTINICITNKEIVERLKKEIKSFEGMNMHHRNGLHPDERKTLNTMQEILEGKE